RLATSCSPSCARNSAAILRKRRVEGGHASGRPAKTGGRHVKIEVYPDDNVVARKAAAVIADAARAAASSRGRFIMAVSGGHTPWSMLRALAGDELPWPQVHIVQVDERGAPAADPDRNLPHLRASLQPSPPPPHTSAGRRPAPWPARRPLPPPAAGGGGPPAGARPRPSRPRPGRPHRIAGARRSSPRHHGCGRRSDRFLPRPTPDDLDVSDHQPLPPRAVAGDRRGRGRRPPAPCRRRSGHSSPAPRAGSLARAR